jgi:hypothetical protein
MDEVSSGCKREGTIEPGIATLDFDPEWFVPVYKIVDCVFWEICEFPVG